MAKPEYNPEHHCQSCYEATGELYDSLDNCEYCFECLVSTNDSKHLFECWGVHQAE